MSKFVTIPGPVTLIDPVTYEVLPKDRNGGTKSFAEAIRTICVAAGAARTVDITDLAAVRARVDTAKVGEVIEITDPEWAAFEPEFRKPHPQLFPPQWYVVLESHVRAWLDAPSKRPVVMREPTGVEPTPLKAAS